MRKRRKLHDFIIKTITGIMAVLFVLAAGCLDSTPNNVPLTICWVCLGYFVLFIAANRDWIYRGWF